MRYLAIDYGQKRTGLALCDAEERLASPFAVLDNPKEVLAKISATVEKEHVEAITESIERFRGGVEPQDDQLLLVVSFVEDGNSGQSPRA